MEELLLRIDFTRSDSLRTPDSRKEFIADAMRLLGEFSESHQAIITVDPPCEPDQSRVNSNKVSQWAFEEEKKE